MRLFRRMEIVQNMGDGARRKCNRRQNIVLEVDVLTLEEENRREMSLSKAASNHICIPYTVYEHNINTELL